MAWFRSHHKFLGDSRIFRKELKIYVKSNLVCHFINVWIKNQTIPNKVHFIKNGQHYCQHQKGKGINLKLRKFSRWTLRTYFWFKNDSEKWSRFFCFKLNKTLQRYLLSCQANSAFLGWFFCTGQQQLWRGLFNFKIKNSTLLFIIIFKPKMVISNV